MILTIRDLHHRIAAPASLDGLSHLDAHPLEPMATPAALIDALRDLLDREHEFYHDAYAADFADTADAARARGRLRALYVALQLIADLSTDQE